MPVEKYSKFLITFAYYGVIAALAFVVIRYALPIYYAVPMLLAVSCHERMYRKIE